MKRKSQQFVIYFFLLLANIVFAGNTSSSLSTKLQNEGVCFTENKGQVKDQNWQARPDVIFSGTSGNMVYHMRKNGISYQQYRIDKWEEEELPGSIEKTSKMPAQTTTYRTDIFWEGINTNYSIEKEFSIQGYNNYYNVPEGIAPALNVKSYEGVWLRGLYKGIDMHYYGSENTLKYDFVVAPNSDYHQIKIRIEGAELQIKEDGSLQLITPLGVIEEGKPVAYQGEQMISANWEINGNVLNIKLGDYNKEEVLYIDPPVREWGTYYGNLGSDVGTGVATATDGSGDVNMAGITASVTAIATVGAHQTIYGGVSYDGFLVRFNKDGIRQWGTYYGGADTDRGYGCDVDAAGNIYLAGHTSSLTGISTAGAHQTTKGVGPNPDCYLVKFNSSGVRQWGTYYGGDVMESSGWCNVDNNGDVYLTGWTTSPTAIASPGSYQSVLGGGRDGFIVKFDAFGVRQWGTYYGGTLNDYGASCDFDAYNNVYFFGYGTSASNIATAGVHQTTIGGANDAFLVKFNSAGVRRWATYYGGTLNDYAYSCAVDSDGDIYFVGYTSSTTGIATIGAHQETYGGGAADVFFAKLDSTGAREWGTYYGGVERDEGFGCTVDDLDRVYLVGRTESTSGISTVGTHQEIYGGGNYDAFMAQFNSSGIRQWSTYYGGTGFDYAYPCAIDDSMYIYLPGTSGSDSTVYAIATLGAHQTILGAGGGTDAFLVKFNACQTTYDTISPTACGTYISPIGNVYNITGTYYDTLVDANFIGCDSIITIYLIVNSIPTKSQQVFVECEGFSVTVGANTYNSTGVYTDIDICDTIVTDLTIKPIPVIAFIKVDDNCGDSIGSIAIDTSPTIGSYTWDNGDTTSMLTNLSEGIYSIIVLDTNGCSDTEQIMIDNLQIDCVYPVYIPNAFSPNGDGFNDEFLIRGLDDIDNFNMKIYNRWGVKVFETKQSNIGGVTLSGPDSYRVEGWDGKQHGKMSPKGVYVYYIDVAFIGTTESFVAKGNVTLIR